jgi:spermidine/putrescine transport system permease protein
MILRETGILSKTLQATGVVGQPVEFLYNDGAVVLGLVYGGLLFMIVPLVNALDSLDPSLVEAGYDLGGSRLTVLRRIVIPHAMPGIVAGSIVVFMLTVGNYATPLLLGGKNGLWFTEQIYAQFITRFNWPQGSAFGFLLLGLSSLIVWLGLKLSGQSLARTLRQG